MGPATAGLFFLQERPTLAGTAMAGPTTKTPSDLPSAGVNAGISVSPKSMQFTRNDIETSTAYAGVGSRMERRPPVELMTKAARRLAEMGFTLYSGAASGSDAAFEAGAGDAKRIFLPWRGFNGSASQDFDLPEFGLAARIAADHHPRWTALSMGERKLHARNTFQVLGPSLSSPVRFVLCWTPDGCESGPLTTRETGGTGTAIRIASSFGIPVFNMKNKDALQRLGQLISPSAQPPQPEAQASHRKVRP